jgi:superfamily I DNA and/or RNA helicase
MPPVDILVVDEAAQATEPEALIPLGLEPRAMLVCGDPYQLSCTCLSRRAKAAGLERSLMQRIMDAGSASRFFFLEQQYRMHPAISAFPSRRFYSGRLKDASVCASRPGVLVGDAGGDSAWLGRPWTFLDVSGNGEERDNGGSVCNRDEAAAVLATVCALRGCGVDIGRTRSLRVLTFYSAQVRCVCRTLEAAGVREGVMVGTVDGAQGAESDVVILSFVRSNNNVPLHQDLELAETERARSRLATFLRLRDAQPSVLLAGVHRFCRGLAPPQCGHHSCQACAHHDRLRTHPRFGRGGRGGQRSHPCRRLRRRHLELHEAVHRREGAAAVR